MKRITMLLLWLCLYTSEAEYASAGELYDHFPNDIDPNAKYVFYSHGFIVEGDDPKPNHPRWGTYDFPKVTESLLDIGPHLIAYHRPKGADAQKHAKKLSDEAKLLIASGVAPKNITFIGFSRGGVISILVSKTLKDREVNFAVLAACGNYINENLSIEFYGNILSIRETSDDLVGSCAKLAARSSELTSFQEVSISTGEEHGAFYRPKPEWIEPLREWMERK